MLQACADVDKKTGDMSTVFEMRDSKNSWSNDWKSTQTLPGRVIK